MPRLVDYAARREFIGEAVIRLASSEGAGAVTIPRVARELGVSPDTIRRFLGDRLPLHATAVDLIVRRRIHRGMMGPGQRMDDPAFVRVRGVLLQALPLDAERLEESSAWTVLTAAFPDAHVTTLRRDADRARTALMGRALVLLEVPEEQRDVETLLLQALVNGLTGALVRGWATAEQVTTALDAHLAALAARGLEEVA